MAFKFYNNIWKTHQHLLSSSITTNQQSIKKLWAYVAIAFNKVDTERLKLVGPDRLCAEWILKNGGGVCFTAAPSKYLRDYNLLPGENVRLQLKEIDGTNSSIMKIGFDHLKDCKYIDKIILHNCKHLESDSLEGLLHVRDTLKFLQVSGCYNFADKSLMPLKELKNLQKLILFDLQYVNNLNNVVVELLKSLPKCEISTNMEN